MKVRPPKTPITIAARRAVRKETTRESAKNENIVPAGLELGDGVNGADARPVRGEAKHEGDGEHMNASSSAPNTIRGVSARRVRGDGSAGFPFPWLTLGLLVAI